MSQFNNKNDTKPVPRNIVAAVLSYQGQLALFKRSLKVRGDQGLWHCITGFLDESCHPIEQAKTEIKEEAGLHASQLEIVGSHILELNDAYQNLWRIHAFHFETSSQTLTTNWENDAAKWCHPEEMHTLNTVPWLASVTALFPLDNSIYTPCATAWVPAPRLRYAV